jgi:NAD-dependent deacetylase
MKRQYISEVAKLITTSKYTVVFTGAGVSAESGIPTFRGENGLWKKYDPEEVASIRGFMADPRRFWRFAKELSAKLTAEPNPAHYAIAKLEEMGFVKAVITQNIDGLHQKAGSKNVYELHGGLNYIDCLKCGETYRWDDILKIIDDVKCKSCGSIHLKPRVVFFGEELPLDTYYNSLAEAQKADLMLVIGSSLTVYPAAYIPEVCKSRGGKLVLINREESLKDHIFDIIIYGEAGKIMDEIYKEVVRIVER